MKTFTGGLAVALVLATAAFGHPPQQVPRAYARVAAVHSIERDMVQRSPAARGPDTAAAAESSGARILVGSPASPVTREPQAILLLGATMLLVAGLFKRRLAARRRSAEK